MALSLSLKKCFFIFIKNILNHVLFQIRMLSYQSEWENYRIESALHLFPLTTLDGRLAKGYMLGSPHPFYYRIKHKMKVTVLRAEFRHPCSIII